MSDANVLHNTTDGVVWAREMAETFKRLGIADLDPAPGELLHVWLCNAIETGGVLVAIRKGAATASRTGRWRRDERE